jgi:hypothetical protein
VVTIRLFLFFVLLVSFVVDTDGLHTAGLVGLRSGLGPPNALFGTILIRSRFLFRNKSQVAHSLELETNRNSCALKGRHVS